MGGWAEQPRPAQVLSQRFGFRKPDFPSLQEQITVVDIAMETDGANMNEVNEAQEGLVVFLVKYIFYLSLHTKKYYECSVFNHLETSAPFCLFMV